MSDEATDPIPPELQTWVDCEIHVEGRHSVAAQQALHAELASQPGVATLSFSSELIVIRYDPERTTIAHLSEIIVRAGVEIGEVESGPIAPTIDTAADVPDEF